MFCHIKRHETTIMMFILLIILLIDSRNKRRRKKTVFQFDRQRIVSIYVDSSSLCLHRSRFLLWLSASYLFVTKQNQNHLHKLPQSLRDLVGFYSRIIDRMRKISTKTVDLISWASSIDSTLCICSCLCAMDKWNVMEDKRRNSLNTMTVEFNEQT